MGRTYLFECSRCGYRVCVSGGADGGERFAVQTIACTDCKELYDAVTEFKTLKTDSDNKAAPRFAVVLNCLPMSGAQVRLTCKPACPVMSWHSVQVWNRPGKCPKCGSFLDRDGIPFHLWD